MCTSTAHVYLLQFLIYFIASSNAIGKFESRGRGLAVVYGNTVPEMRA